MADDSKIVSGFYRDVPISITNGSISGGRKKVIKNFPNMDTQSVEDLGLKPRSYNIDIIVNDKPAEDYFSYRDRLLSALENPTPAPLIHPFYGRIEDVVSTSFNITERIGEFGSATISVVFEVNTNTGVPKQSSNVLSQLKSKNDSVISAVGLSITNGFSVTKSFSGNFLSAINKVNQIIEAVNNSTSFLSKEASVINSFSSELGELSANVNSLITNPINLSNSITGIFSTINGLYSSTDATFDAFKGFFGFGDDDIFIEESTAGKKERKNNNDILNWAVQSQSLGYAYVAASDMSYTTTEQIDETSQILEDQFKIIMNGNNSQDVNDALIELRLIAIESLKSARLNARQVITINSDPTSARLLSFTYYGNDELSEDIINLNDLKDVSFVSGELRILTS